MLTCHMFWVDESSSSSCDSYNNVIDALCSLTYLQMQFIADICFWESLPLWDAHFYTQSCYWTVATHNYYYQLLKNSFSCLLLVPLIFHFPDASSKLKGPGVPLTFVRTIHCYSSLQLQRRLQTFTISGLCTFYLLCIYYFYSLTKNP